MAAISKKAFWLLPKKDRKILVAKDILKQLKLGTIKAHAGWYFKGNFFIRNNPVFKNLGLLESCPVCELGACILSIGNLGNEITFEEAAKVGNWDSNHIPKAQKLLLKVFSKEEVKMLEACFEGEPYVAESAFNKRLTFEEKERVEYFREQFRSDTERMKAISENIIKNKGRFILPSDTKK